MTESPAATTDSDLLRRYVRQRDENAFAQLVGRHQAMVVGVAGRRMGDLDLAHDAAQRVFVLLARKASQLLAHDHLAGWLYQTASFEAAKLHQAESRRRFRQTEFAALPASDQACHEQWQILDEAISALSGSDRELIVRHYLEDRSYAEMAAVAALSESAMRKRVSRAMEHLSRQLQRRGLGVSGVSLLTTAVAMQATLPAHAAMAGTALAGAGPLTSAWFPWTAFMSTHTALKTAAVTAILAAVPLVWQTHVNAGLRAEVSRLEQPAHSALPLATPAPPALVNSSRPSDPAQLAAARARLQSLREQRAQGEAHLASLKAQAAKLNEEVVVSLGRVDEIANKVARMQKLAMEMERLDGRQEEQDKLAPQLMEGMSELMPLMAEFKKLSADPKLSARLTATTTAAVAGVSDHVRDEMERRLLRHFEAMGRSGLTLDRRPAENHGDWDRRYGIASAAAMRDIENLLPPAMRETTMWKSQTSAEAEGHLNFLDAFFGPSTSSSTPPAPANEASPDATPGLFIVEP
jgi:RNA polymerase sigma factor (sigma-70 family)